MRVRLTRFNKETDGELLWNIYQDDQYSEFFRRAPPSWTSLEVHNFESLTQSQLFTVLWDEWPVGFAVVTQIDPFALTCQVGLLLFPDYRDKIVDGYKIGFWSIYRLCEMLFERTTIRKLSMRFLKSREDIEKSLSRSGFWKESDLKESCLCYGKFQDEFEYAFNKESFEKVKESVCRS